MTTPFIAQRVIAAAVLATTALLLGAVPAAASTEQSEGLRGWVADRDTTTNSPVSTQSGDLRGWVADRDTTTNSPVSTQSGDLRGWVADRDTTQNSTSVSSSSGMRAVQRDITASQPVPVQPQSRAASSEIPPQLIVAGLLLAALLGAAGAVAVNHRRHVPTAH